MKERILDLMDRALSAYAPERIRDYVDRVKREGLTEHGFPRLTSDVGILIAHGRRPDLLPLFLDMMDVCCRAVPACKAANEFSVREMIVCIREVEATDAVPAAVIADWKARLAAIEPEKVYTRFVRSADEDENNGAIFAALSEFYRQKAGLCDATEFVEAQLGSQVRRLDENGMYRDENTAGHNPIVYDLVARGLLSLLLCEGYRGRYYREIDDALRKAGRATLLMQAPGGEIPFGGRSNRFWFNEPWLAAILEFEAKRYQREGDCALAARFRGAALRALAVTERGLSRRPVRHVKNRFPTETGYGCENYAYFDKYMITVASNLFAARSILDESIPADERPDCAPAVFATTPYFHKLFLKGGGYGLEFDLDADPAYDACGLGRIQRDGAPADLCLSHPCPARPRYRVDLGQTVAASACSAVPAGDGWLTGAEEGSRYIAEKTRQTEDRAAATLLCRFPDGRTVREAYEVGADGVNIRVSGEGKIAFFLPALGFDGERSPVVTRETHALTVNYEGWICRYRTDGVTSDETVLGANRGGHVRFFPAVGTDVLSVCVQILPAP